MKTVIEMAREANIKQAIETPHLLMVSELERFAELVRADEGEACAGLCDRLANQMMSAEECAAATRARRSKT